MKFSKWLLTTALVLSTQLTSVEAKEACAPCVKENTCDLCDINFCDIQYSGYVDALYWSVCKGDLSTDVDGDDVEYINPKYQWGYRLGGVAHWRNWDFGTRWTSYTNDSSKKVNGDDYDFHLRYSVLDFELGYNCCMDCGPFAFRPFVGAKLAWIKDRFNENDGQYIAKVKDDAVGLYIGSSARWQLCNYSMCDRNIPIALVARASGGVMHSEFSSKYPGPSNEEPDHKKHCIYNLYYDVALALDFSYCGFCGTDLFFQIGYEAQSWDSVEYYSWDDDTKLGLGGLVLRFGAEF